MQLLMEAYIERSHSLWKEPEVLSWLQRVIPLAKETLIRAAKSDLSARASFDKDVELVRRSIDTLTKVYSEGIPIRYIRCFIVNGKIDTGGLASSLQTW